MTYPSRSTDLLLTVVLFLSTAFIWVVGALNEFIVTTNTPSFYNYAKFIKVPKTLRFLQHHLHSLSIIIFTLNILPMFSDITRA